MQNAQNASAMSVCGGAPINASHGILLNNRKNQNCVLHASQAMTDPRFSNKWMCK